jgi:alpha 1,3-glucosidase
MYGLMTQRATYEGQILRDPNARPFVLSRSFFVGTQRWGPIWTGDNGAEWSHLKSSIPMLLSLGITGRGSFNKLKLSASNIFEFSVQNFNKIKS